MKLRDWLNNNSAIVTIGAVVLLIGALFAIIMQMSGGSSGPRVIDVYFYDLNKNQLFTAKSDAIPPIDTDSGATPQGAPAGVRAYVFACNDCGDENDRFIGWLEMYTPEAKALLTQPAADNPEQAAEREMRMYEVWETGQLIRGVNDTRWVPQNSQEAMTITSQIETKCPGGAPKPCLPGR